MIGLHYYFYDDGTWNKDYYIKWPNHTVIYAYSIDESRWVSVLEGVFHRLKEEDVPSEYRAKLLLII